MASKDDDWIKGLDGPPRLLHKWIKSPGLEVHVLRVSIGGRPYIALRDWVVQQERYTAAVYLIPFTLVSEIGTALQGMAP